MKIKKLNLKHKVVLLCIAILLLVGLCTTLLVINSRDNSNIATSIKDGDAKTTSTVRSAQSDFTSNDNSKNATTDETAKSSGSIADSNGTTTQANNAASITSQNGKVTLFNPVPNSLLTSQTNVSGSSSLSQVSYRIADDAVGVISSGSLNVVNGKFSGTVTISSKAASGQLSFFGTDELGDEFDTISVPVRFK